MIVIMLISVCLYLVVAMCIYKAMPEIKKERRFRYIIIGFIVIFLITFVIAHLVNINTVGKIEKNIEIARRTATYLLAPINSIILMLYGISASKFKGKRINKTQFNKRLIIYFVLFIIFIILEKSYMQNFIEGLLN